jgi:hypothetical protein
MLWLEGDAILQFQGVHAHLTHPRDTGESVASCNLQGFASVSQQQIRMRQMLGETAASSQEHRLTKHLHKVHTAQVDRRLTTLQGSVPH